MPSDYLSTADSGRDIKLSRHQVHIELDIIPNIKYLMAKAVFKKAQNTRNPKLPITELSVDNVLMDSQKIDFFHQIVDWQGGEASVHTCFIHTLAFPLQLALISTPDFPFALLGLVHIDNKIRQYRPIKATEKLRFVCRLGDLTVHRKGWLFGIVVECFSGNECVWKSTSTNLYRANHGLDGEVKGFGGKLESKQTRRFNWLLSESLGRQYAKASGDYNPIHLTKWTAKLLGFKRHIAHGMWTKSKCISQLQQYKPSLFDEMFEVDCHFKQPLYLPSRAELIIDSHAAQAISPKTFFEVVSTTHLGEHTPHLKGCFSLP